MKVLITGNIFHEYEFSIGNAFENLGCEVHMHFFNYEGPFYPTFQTFKWLKYGFFPEKLGLKYFYGRDYSRYNTQLKNKIADEDYDLVLVIKGLTLEPDTLDNFSGIKALWVLDSISRFKELQKRLSKYNLVYSYEPSDIDYCQTQLGIKIKFLPVAFDPIQYRPIITSKKHLISFVGGRKPNRESFIKQISKVYPVTLVGDFHKSDDWGLRKNTILKVADHSSINEFYNQSVFNLNIHKPQSVRGVNPRFFEILGSGGVQLVDPKPMVTDFEDGKDLIYYKSAEECLEKILFYKDKPDLLKKISHAGYAKAKGAHTWKHRISKILEDVKNLSRH